MELMDVIRARKSYRGIFQPTPIPREDLREILEAGLLAPSGCNLQTTRLIAVDEPALLSQLADLYGHEWAASAPAAILVLTKVTASFTGASYHVQDYSAAAENMLLAIAGKGYASVWIEGQIRGVDKKMGALLGVPEDMTVAIYMPVGVPSQDTPHASKVPFDERAWFNGYQTTEK